MEDSRLKTLPLELRNMIYNQYFAETIVDLSEQFETQRSKQASNFDSIMHVCRKFKEEILDNFPVGSGLVIRGPFKAAGQVSSLWTDAGNEQRTATMVSIVSDWLGCLRSRGTSLESVTIDLGTLDASSEQQCTLRNQFWNCTKPPPLIRSLVKGIAQVVHPTDQLYVSFTIRDYEEETRWAFPATDDESSWREEIKLTIRSEVARAAESAGTRSSPEFVKRADRLYRRRRIAEIWVRDIFAMS